MATSMVALPVAGAGFGSDGTDAPADAEGVSPALDRVEEEPTPEDRADDDGASTSDVTVDENLTDAEGTVEVLASVEEIDAPLAAGQEGAVVDDLRAHAETSQEPLVEYAAETDGIEVRNRFWITNAVLLEVDLERADLREVAAQKGVDRLSKNYEVQVPEPVEVGADAETTYGLEQVNAPDVWDEYDTMGEGAKIAVLDTGVDPDHPDIDIDPENWAEFDEDGNVVDSEPHDTQYHGTHTSGTVVGGDASGEYIGVAPEATLMHGAVIPSGSGSIAQIIAGIEWAVEEDADAVSMSLGVADYIADFVDVHQNARAAGTTVIASSGNDGEGSSSSPGNDYESIAVGASNENENVASFSSGETVDTALAWGESAPDHWPDEYVVPTVAAPGVDVKSAHPDEGYDRLSGTSMAAPHVAGTTALMVAAADDTPSPDEIQTALESSAWKPDGEPEEQDERYGHGIINAKTATDRVAADQGVTGTVTDADGNPIEGASVSLESGFTTTTDANGEYTISGTETEMDVTVERFGYESESETVTVPDGEFATQDFELAAHVDVRPTEVPDGAIAGENTTFEFETANVESLTVDLAGELGADEATLYVDGEEVDFGEPYEAADLDGEVAVDLWVPADAVGTFSLEFAFDGLGETVTHEVADLEVFENTYDVGVVDTPDNEFGFVLAQDLDGILPINYDVSFVSTDEVMENVDEYDTFVVQRFGNGDPGAWTGDYELAAEFAEATDDPSTSVVYLDQYGDWSGAIHELSQATGDPVRADQKYWVHNTSAPLTQTVYQVRDDHPIFDGVAEEGDEVALYDSVFTGEKSWFEGSSGDVIADVGWEGLEPAGQGLAVDTLRNSAYVASMGRTTAYHDGGWSSYSEEADQILANTVEYVSGDAPMSIAEDQPDRVPLGEPVTVEFDVEDLDKIAVGLDDERSTVSEEDLSLYVDGSINAFDEYRAYDAPKTGTVTVEVVPDEPVHGTVALEHTLVADDGERQSGGTGPTSMYDAPLEVPNDVETIQEAVDLATGAEEIVVDDGTYEEQIEVRDGGMDGLTIRAAEGASPTLVLPDDPVERWAFNLQTDDQTPVVYVRHTDDVTISGFEIDAGGEVGAFVTDTHDVTLSDLNVTNATTGLWIDFWSIGTTVEDSTITDSGHGVFSYWGNDFGQIRNNEIADVDVGVETDHVIDEVDVVDNEVRNATTGYLIDGGDGRLDGNTAENVSTGLYLSTSGDVASLDDNTVANATTGIQDSSVNTPDMATGNDIEAETGVSDSGWSGPPGYHLNDFSGSDLVVDAAQQIDAQLNYLGERTGDDQVAADDVEYAPYLTAAPENVSGWDTSQIGTDFHLEAGETYAVGVPGPTEQTISDVVDDEAEGTVYGFDAETQEWEQLMHNDDVNALDVLVVVAETDAKLSLEFQSDDAPSAPGQTDLEEGWNLVAPPTYGDADSAFDSGTFEPGLLQSPFESPDGQLGPAGDVDGLYTFDDGDAPHLSAFEGYFVFVEEDGILPAHLASNPDTETLYETLGIEDQYDFGTAETATVEDVLEVGADEDRTHDALVEVIADDLRDELDAVAENATTSDELEAVRTAADETVADAPDEHRQAVTDATAEAVDLVVAVEFGTNVAHHDVWEPDETVDSIDDASIAPPAGA